MPTRQADWINQMNVQELINERTLKTEAVRELVDWSQNFDLVSGTPYQVFLDLIEYSADLSGELIVKNLKEIPLGFLELDLIANALKEYAKNPNDVLKWIEQLNALEGSNDEN